MKQNKIELLDPSLLDSKEFKIVDYWIKVFKLEIGWHYHLDLVWQLKEIKKLNLAKNDTIIDAGAGLGLMQFILASLGYNILSIDFTQRKASKIYSSIFNIKYEKKGLYENEYVTHMNNLFSITKNKKRFNFLERLNFKNIFEFIRTRIKSYGEIKFITSDFSNLSFIQDNSISAIVSTSAIEHNDSIEKLSFSIKEFERVLKKNAPMLITTSASNKATWWHKPSKGYCFSESDLIKTFNISNFESNFDKYPNVLLNIQDSNYLKAKMPSFYLNNPNCGMPNGIWDPKYLPVGIRKFKDY